MGAPDEVTVVNGIRVSTAPRTVIDIARWEGFEQAVVVGDSALHRGLTTREELGEHLCRAVFQPGYHRAVAVLDFLDGRSACVGESRSRVALYQGGLPVPELHAHVFTAARDPLGQADFLFDELGVIGEFDRKGRDSNGLPQVHTTDATAGRADADQLRALGWSVVRWSWDELDDPAELCGRIRAAAADARGRRRAGYWRPAG